MKTIKNTHKVPQKQWRKWDELGRKAFNDLFEMMEDQDLFSHPKALKQKPAHWRTTRWNASWMAADLASGI